eukprot:CAMPEP_0184341416 /NCGR_PEP_ID=MMETSP1089-20130417/10032_1 /TAXON_ID=38269 ORGANISM="Gloeochaete wittrockiana, Strain SAG46.84" /NCGR_SAMPLE_ID=MMETSP1089 /ASSEMBLY_ACC=CAM_ASM_000445 /LENGTH=768 /DNA_ID=CAMNT_0026669695 /DNA_START=41 /DNA_END=2347 /DNA_ORIENTATION=-
MQQRKRKTSDKKDDYEGLHVGLPNRAVLSKVTEAFEQEPLLAVDKGNKGDNNILLGTVIQSCIILLIGFQWSLMVSSFSEWAPTFDEPGQLTAGYTYIKYGDFRDNPEQGLLPSVWMAIPAALFSNASFPHLESDDWKHSQTFPLADRFFYATAGNDPHKLIFSGRLMMSILPSLLGIMVYRWSRSLFGIRGGLLSLALLSFSPAFLAHGSLCTSDMAVTLFLMLSLKTVWNMFYSLSILSFAISCIALVSCFLSKMSALVMIPVTLCLLFVRIFSSTPLTIHLPWSHAPKLVRSRAAMLLCLLCVLIIGHVTFMTFLFWAAYLFRYSAFRVDSNLTSPSETPSFPVSWEDLHKSAGDLLGSFVEFARQHRLYPEAFLYNFAHTLHMTTNRRAFYRGNYARSGFPSYFIFCFFYKTPLPILFIILIGLCRAVTRSVMRGLRRPGKSPGTSSSTSDESKASTDSLLDKFAPLWVFLAVFWCIAIRSKVNIGERYILPTYPPIYILMGAAVRSSSHRQKSHRRLWSRVLDIAVWLLAVLLVVEVVRYRPNYISYFNQSFGGPKNAWKSLIDSSIDWGQDLKRLSDWYRSTSDLQARNNSATTTLQEAKPLYLSYFGTARPESFNLQPRGLPSFPDRWRLVHPADGDKVTIEYRPGYYAISVSMLWGVYGYYEFIGEWLKPHEDFYWDLYRTLLEEAGKGFIPMRVAHRWDSAVFHRLRSFLQQREPDLQIGYSILVYDLTQEQLQKYCYSPHSGPLNPSNVLVFNPMYPM